MNFSFINTRWILASTINSSSLNIDCFIKKEVFEVESTKDLICKSSSKYEDFLYSILHDLTIMRAPKSFFIYVLLNPIVDNASVLALSKYFK